MRIIGLTNKYRLEITNFFVGAVVLSFELAAARVVAPYIGTTIYTWTSVIGVILASLALGYGLGGYYADKRHRTEDVVSLLCLAAVSIMLVIVFKDWVLVNISHTALPLQWQALVVSLLLFSIPTFLLGAVSPYLARLNITNVSSSGFSLARINAAGTLGSLVGTFITGYFLFSLLGSRYILTWLALCLLLISFILSRFFKLVVRAILLVIGLAMLLYSPPAKLAHAAVIEDTDTSYSRVIVSDRMYNNRPVRILQTDNTAWQSGVYLDGSKELVFGYTKVFAEVLNSHSGVNKVLVIGGGSFSFPEYIANKYPQMDIDVVEIDPKLTRLSEKYFGFKQPKNLRIVNKDGRQFINTSANKYDLIFMDAFSSSTPPFQLLTQEAIQKIKAITAKDGLVVVNLISSAEGPKSGMAGGASATYESVFKKITVWQVDGNVPKTINQNLVLIAGGKELKPQLNKDLESVGAKVFHDKKSQANFVYSEVFTDDLAPVEKLSADALR